MYIQQINNNYNNYIFLCIFIAALVKVVKGKACDQFYKGNYMPLNPSSNYMYISDALCH